MVTASHYWNPCSGAKAKNVRIVQNSPAPPETQGIGCEGGIPKRGSLPELRRISKVHFLFCAGRPWLFAGEQHLALLR